MANGVEFAFSLIDKASGPAEKISGALEGAQEGLEKLSGSSGKVDKLSKAVNILTIGLRALQIASAAIDLVKAFGGLDKLKAGLSKLGAGVVSFGMKLGAFAKKHAGKIALGGGGALLAKGLFAAVPAAGGLSLGIAAIGTAAVAATAAIGMIGVKAGLAFGGATLEAVRFRDSTIRGLRVITHSTEAAKQVFDEAFALANKLGLGTKDTIGGMQELLSKGFDKSMATDLIKATGDLKIVSPQTNTEGLIRAISQIKTAGHLQGDELEQLAEAGLNTGAMFSELEKITGKTRTEVLKLKQAGQITADMFNSAFKNTVRTMTGMDLGALAAQESFGIDGLLTRLKDLPDRFFLAVAKALEGSGLNQLLADIFGSFSLEGAAAGAGDIIRSIVDTIVANKPSIMAFINGLKAGLSGAFEGLSAAWRGIKSAFGGKGMDPAKMAAGFKALGTMIGQAAVGAGVFLAAATGVLGVIAAGFAASTAMIGKIMALGAQLFGAAVSLGANIISGLVNGITAGATLVIDAIKGVVSGAIDIAKTVLDISSPSRVFEDIGMNTALGFEQGVDSRAPQARVSLQDMVSTPSPREGGRSSVRMGDITINVNVEGGGKDAATIGRDIGLAVRLELEGLALESGL
jgi:tape measure domain-containing protein